MCNVTTNHHAKEKYEYGSMASIVDTSDSNTGNAIEHIHNNEYFMQRKDGDEFHFVSYCCAVFHSLSKHRIIYSILFGQVLALLLATSAAANSTLYNDCEVSLPTAQTFLVYFCLFLLHAPSLCLQESEVFDCSSPKWYHFLLPSLLDVEANYLCVLALRYSTLTSVTILDAFAIPSSMFFSKILSVRKESFGSHHYVGVMICSLGLCMTVLSDGFIQENEVNKGNNPLLGDALALLGGIFYGLNDTIAEKFVKDYDREKYLGFLGLFGGIISLAQITFIEMDQFDVFINGNSLCSSYHVGGLVLSAVIPNSLFYIGVSLFLSKLSDASMLNLSLLTSDLWAMAFSMFYQKFIPTYFYFIALIVIVVGCNTFLRTTYLIGLAGYAQKRRIMGQVLAMRHIWVVAVFNMQRVNVVQTNEFALFAPTKTPTIQISYSKDSALYPTPAPIRSINVPELHIQDETSLIPSNTMLIVAPISDVFSLQPTLASTLVDGMEASPPTIVDTIPNMPLRPSKRISNTGRSYTLVSIVLPIFSVCVIIFLVSLALTHRRGQHYRSNIKKRSSANVSLSDHTSETGDILNTFDIMDDPMRTGIPIKNTVLFEQIGRKHGENENKTSKPTSICNWIKFK